MKMPNKPDKYEVLIKQYLRSILDISEMAWEKTVFCFSYQAPYGIASLASYSRAEPQLIR